MTGAIPLLLLYAFMAWPGISLIFGSCKPLFCFTVHVSSFWALQACCLMSTCGAFSGLRLPELKADHLILVQRLGMRVTLTPLFMTTLTL